MRCETADPSYIGRADDTARRAIVTRRRHVWAVLRLNAYPLLHGVPPMQSDTQHLLRTNKNGHRYCGEYTALDT